MKAYFIGGCLDQTKMIVADDPPRFHRAVVPLRMPVTPYLSRREPKTERIDVIYHDYHLICPTMPGTGEYVAIYLYDEKPV